MAPVPPPAPPPDSEWTFIDDLKAPLWQEGLGWTAREIAHGEADLRRGVRIGRNFDDQKGLLETAYADLDDFLSVAGVPSGEAFAIETAPQATSVFEAFRIEVSPDRCRILAADTEGIRRGIFKVEELMRAAGGPFLPLGNEERHPFIKARISRCFFGPVKRPPRMRDELMDDVGYYPDEYLNRLAHEGINGLWLTIEFRDLCRTGLAPEYGEHAARRLAKLRRTVRQCRRYGIGTYIFAIEPRAWDAESPVLGRHPEMGGAGIADRVTFCPWSDAAQRYLYEATNLIFSQVPDLAGMINISHGERLTHCQNAVPATSNEHSPCPRCARREPWEIIFATLDPMARGMHDANRDANFIAWFYMPQDAPLGDWVYELPKHCPAHVTMQFNFESGVTKHVFGRGRRGADYWISEPGPSRRFERLAATADSSGTPMAAKIQTGCSHEVATVPFVPVPGMLYRKFAAMRELGVSSVMLCWYFGNYPGIMNRAAGALAFEPFPSTEAEFLRRLLLPDWGRHCETVARALELFGEGYGHYPLVTEFQYWGPMHDGVVWPLHLLPQDSPMAPTWQIAWHTGNRIGEPFAPSGDRIGEALGRDYTLSEAIEECRTMSSLWDRGLVLLKSVESDPAILPERLRDIGVAQALGLQFRSGLNILRFYDLRERMTCEVPPRQLTTLGELRRIVEEELAAGAELVALCECDSRLGFHSEAEGYKYFPAKIRWRMERLEALLARDFPALERAIVAGVDVFAEYTGRSPAGPVIFSKYCGTLGENACGFDRFNDGNPEWRSCRQPFDDQAAASASPAGFQWTVRHDREALYVAFQGAAEDDQITLALEPRRLWTCQKFTMRATGEILPWSAPDFSAFSEAEGNYRRGWIRLSFAAMGMNPAQPVPLRINLWHESREGGGAWIARHPWPPRLRLCNENPANLGWLFFPATRR